jgi:hypothetical protein
MNNRPRVLLLISLLLVTGILAGWLVQFKSPLPLLLDTAGWVLVFSAIVIELRRPS